MRRPEDEAASPAKDMTMLLDLPGRFLYRHRFDTYSAMRVFCARYTYLVIVTVAVAMVVLTVWLNQPAVLHALGIVVRAD